jgi:hypothetical protein
MPNKIISKEYYLSQNYANPFNPSTMIDYDLPKAGMVTMKVYDLYGREVATLVNSVKEAGTQHAVFNGSRLASGVYFVRMATEVMSSTIRIVLMKQIDGQGNFLLARFWLL